MAATAARREPLQDGAHAQRPSRRRPRATAATAAVAVRAALALAVSAVRYRRTVAPVVRAQMAGFQRAAAAIPEPRLCALAIEKLAQERFNAEAAAMVATMAPPAARSAAARAILAVEVAFDYLDGRTELALADPVAEGLALCEPFVAALSRPAAEVCSPDPYLQLLALEAQGAIAELPACEAVAPQLARCAARAVQAQVRMHAAGALGTDQLREWALTEGLPGTLGCPEHLAERPQATLGWRERLAACACSVLAVHALIAAAADPATTPALAAAIEAAYMPACATMTLLDGLLDRAEDLEGGRLTYAGLYESPQLLADAIRSTAEQARERCVRLPRAADHASVLAGALAYWISSPQARDPEAAAALAGLRDELGALVAPPLITMRAWRALRALRAQQRSRRRGASCKDRSR